MTASVSAGRLKASVVDHRSDSRIDMGQSILFPDASPFPFGQLPAAAIGSGDIDGRPERERVYGNTCVCRHTFEDLVVAL